MKNFETVSLVSGLYLVATPIGNLRDITLRALDVLASVDIVLCEDTRITGKLLKAFDIKAKLMSYNDHNATKQRGSILEKLSSGGRVALVSDAGTPLVSDPGFKLVRDCIDLGIFVTSLPGANAPLSALQLSGQPSDSFSFLGFLPSKETARIKAMKEWLNTPGSLIMFETSPRLVDSLKNMLEVWGDRQAAVVRELTKLYEESRHDRLSSLIEIYEEEGPPKGEIVIVVGPGEDKVYSREELIVQIFEAMNTMSLKDASAHVAKKTGKPKKEIYQLALSIKKD